MANALKHSDSVPFFISGLVTQGDLDLFREKGAICIRGVVDIATIETLREAFAKVMEIQWARAEAAGTPRPSEPQFHAILRASDDSEVLRDFHLNSALPKVARDLMQSRKVIVFGDTLLNKEAGCKERTPWHHDIPFWPLRGEQACSTWVALDHVAKDNGAMEYVAGSHRWGKMFTPNSGFGQVKKKGADLIGFDTIPDFDAERDRYEFLSWDMEPGDVLIHQGLTVHGAGENTRLDVGRRAYAPRYVGDQATWEPTAFTTKLNPRTAVLRRGDPLDLHGIYPVALDLDR
jgi:ectoine hydroxylase-related dioxygenase (phytanoyl-CoA dioxygenase family)